MATGNTMADVVVWRWERRRTRWVAQLKDGTVLIAQYNRWARGGYWRAWIDSMPLTGEDYLHPDAAQKAAFDAWKKAAAVKLTKAQLDELKRLARESQPSYGKGRVRVHNNLRRHGFALIDHSDGFVCHITPVGRAFLENKA